MILISGSFPHFMAKNTSVPASIDEKIDQIVLHLQRMDRRDRLRTIGGFFKFIISLIPILLVVWSAWYFVQNWDEIMKQIANQAASSAAEYTQKQGSGLLDQFKKQYDVPKK